MLLGECMFTDPVLLGVMMATKANYPPVRRLERHSSVGATTDVRTFDGRAEAPGDAAMMTPYPRPVRGTLPLFAVALGALTHLR